MLHYFVVCFEVTSRDAKQVLLWIVIKRLNGDLADVGLDFRVDGAVCPDCTCENADDRLSIDVLLHYGHSLIQCARFEPLLGRFD